MVRVAARSSLPAKRDPSIFLPYFSIDDAVSLILNENACRCIVSDPWWIVVPEDLTNMKYVVEKLHWCAWRLLQTARGEADESSFAGYGDDSMVVLSGILSDEESLRSALSDTMNNRRSNVSKKTLLPMPPAPRRSVITEDELHEDAEGRWMAHDTTSISLADKEILRIQREVSCLHTFNKITSQ